jgi:hypothetical protein
MVGISIENLNWVFFALDGTKAMVSTEFFASAFVIAFSSLLDW